MRKRNLRLMAGLTASLTAGFCLPTAPASAITYRSAWMNNWSGCECSAGSLSYTDDQISIFNSHMNAKGHSHNGTFGNGDVWASDVGEDRDYSGEDMYYSDDSVAWAYSGHGDAPTVSGAQHFQVPFCNKGSGSFSGTCNFDATAYLRLGEQSPTYFSSPNAGNNRWMILATCLSVHTAPNEQWWETLAEGTEYVMGYRGLSADSETTDEVLGDWVDNAYASTVYTFKSSWFSAIEDWWVDDTGSVVSGGTNSTDSNWRRDNYSRNESRRSASTWWSYYSWSWHEG
jgi:hypothetical protein